jgi:adhesin HecA-like repeat protein
MIRLDDGDGAEKVEVIDKTGKNRVTIDSATNALTVHADGDVTIESANGKLVLKGASVEVRATSQGVTVEAAGNMDLKAGPQLNVKGGVVNIN